VRTNPDVIGSAKPADCANRLGHAVDHVIPFDKRIVIAANTGEPYVLRPSRFFGCGRHLRRLVDDIDAFGAARPVCPLCPAAPEDGEPLLSHSGI